MSTTPILDAWKVWNKATQPANASQIQTQETQRAFFSGYCQSMHDHVSHCAKTEEEMLAYLENAGREIRQYMKALKQMPRNGLGGN